MKPLLEEDNQSLNQDEQNIEISRILVELIPGIVHEINNSLASAMASIELLQEEMIKLRKENMENNVNLNIIDHIEKLSLLNKSSNPRVQNIIRLLLKEEINKLKEQCKLKNIEETKYEHLDKLITLSINSAKRIDLIVKAFRRLSSLEENDNLIDVNEVLNTSLIILQDQLKNKYVIREDYGQLSLINFNFHNLNYVFICILLKTMELMDTGELYLRTYETEDNIHVNIKLTGGHISKTSLESINDKGPKSKIDFCAINRLLQYRGGNLDIKKIGETIGADIKNDLLGGIIFDMKINKGNSINKNIKSLDQAIVPINGNLEFQDILTKDLPSLPHIENEDRPNSKNILIVDDDSQILVSLFLALKNLDLDHKIIIAKTAEAGIEQLKERNFDLVISDYKLPGMDGINFLCYVKEKYPNTNRVLISAYPNSVLKEEAKSKASVKLFIEKPWVTEGIRKLVQDIEKK